MKNNILLINSGINENTIYKTYCAPLGLLYIAALLEQNGFNVEFIDINMEENVSVTIQETIERFKPSIVGISSLTPSFQQAVAIAGQIKDSHPEIKIVIGGHHPTYFAERILQEYPAIDIVIRKEGEYAFLSIAKGTKPEKVKGITFRKDGLVMETLDRDPIQNLDELPFPARHLADKYEYQYDAHLSSNEKESQYRPANYTSVLTSRGCPFNCRYCANTTFNGNKIRFRSAENVIAELQHLLNEGYDKFFFVDDHFMANPARTAEICDFLIEKRRHYKGIEWQCMARVDAATDELFSKIAAAGCTRVLFGIENGSQKVLDFYNKRINQEKIRKAVELADKYKIKSVASLIIGAPIEDFEDIKETANFLSTLPIDLLEINRLMIFPGTPLWNSLYNQGKIDIETCWQNMITTTEIFDQHTHKQLKEWTDYISRKVYHNPKYIFRRFKKAFSGS
ncbi:B12-binding domain-containing radical SAM protein [Candidatus Margulisiibacteriota bacterium]